MRRHARPVPLARINLKRLRANLRAAAPTSWPRHLAQAFEILNKIDEPRARDLVIEAVGAADACARAIDGGVMARSREEARDKAEKALARLARCAGRAPAELRRRLDRMVKTVLSRGMCDAGDLQRLVHRAGQVLRKFRNEPAAATALRAMGFQRVPTNAPLSWSPTSKHWIQRFVAEPRKPCRSLVESITCRGMRRTCST